jgi:hypothetical protein
MTTDDDLVFRALADPHAGISSTGSSSVTAERSPSSSQTWR